MSVPLRSHYFRALGEPAIRQRALRLGSLVGLVQVALHQGDHWLRGEVTALIVLKSAASVAFAIFVVLLASVSTRAAALRTNASHE